MKSFLCPIFSGITPDLQAYLRDCGRRGVTLPKPFGYEMVAGAPPSKNGQLYEEIRFGVASKPYSKKCIFDPRAFSDINYSPGCHEANPQGHVIEDVTPDLKLLHFRFLGQEWLGNRWRIKRMRLSAINKQHGLSVLQRRSND
jgi:hypothetical protein